MGKPRPSVGAGRGHPRGSPSLGCRGRFLPVCVPLSTAWRGTAPSASPPSSPFVGLGQAPWVPRWAPSRQGCLISGSARCQAAGTAGSGQTGPAACLPALGRNAIHAPGAWLPREGRQAPGETHGPVAAQGTRATFPRPEGAGSALGGALKPKPTLTQLDGPTGTLRPAGLRRERVHKRRRTGPGSLAVGPPPPGSPFS